MCPSAEIHCNNNNNFIYKTLIKQQYKVLINDIKINADKDKTYLNGSHKFRKRNLVKMSF